MAPGGPLPVALQPDRATEATTVALAYRGSGAGLPALIRKVCVALAEGRGRA